MLAVVASILFAFVTATHQGMSAGLVAGAASLFVLGNAVAPRSARVCATLTATEILTDTIAAIRVMVPMLFQFSTRFTADRVALNGTVTGHIRTLPTAQDYNAGQGGYKNGANAGENLLTDIPVVVNKHKHVPIKYSHLVNIASQKSAYQQNINDAAYVLGKTMLNDVLAGAVAANFSEVTTEAIADTNRDTLGAIRKAMNKKGAGSPRFGLVNSDVFEALDSDSRIASRDYYGQQTGGNPLGVLRAVAGFSEIWEYPELPANAENLSGFFCDPRAIAVVTGLPDHSFDLAAQLGIPQVMRHEIVQDPESGLALMAIFWQEQGTADVYMTVTLLWGSIAGKQAGASAAGTAADYAGHRLVTA